MSDMQHELVLAFREAQIGRKYDRYSLSQLDDVDDVLAFVKVNMEQHIEAGRSIWITGDYRKTDVVGHCILKSAVARDFRVLMLTPGELMRLLRDPEGEDDLGDLDLLGVMDFDDPHYLTNPFNPEEVKLVEDTLMRFMRRERSILFHMTPDTPWWSERLRNEIERQSVRFIVCGEV
jgi:hypothetical protein